MTGRGEERREGGKSDERRGGRIQEIEEGSGENMREEEG